MLELIVYPKDGNERLINPSPFCSKIEIFLKMNKVDYSLKQFLGNPAKFPNKKLPVIKDEGKIIFDSTLIIKYLNEKLKINNDAHLSKEDAATGFAFSKMMEEYFYWSLLHERWFIDKNWIKLRDEYFDHMPSLIRKPISGMIRKATRKSADGHGMSRHSDREVMAMGVESLNAISHFLGQKAYFLGEKPTSHDATAYAFISSILHSTLGPELRKHAEKMQNLVDYDERLYKEFMQ